MIKISPEKLQELKTKVDLVELVSYYVPQLKRTGKTFSACCPFHSEKTPSFHISPERQFFKCYGCAKSGDVFVFLQHIENINFITAVELLANRYHIPLEEADSNEKNTPNFERQELLQVLKWATQWFQKQLRAPEGKVALQYLTQRKITEEMFSVFQLGFAPEGWTNLFDAAQREKYSAELLEKAGLIAKNARGNWMDFFRNRVIFPIVNEYQDVIAFGGRTLEPDAKSFKYLNSSDTPVFRKNQTLYGLNLAKKAIQSKRELLMVEGYTDVILCHQLGFNSAVAPLGTSLTENHIKLAHRYADHFILLFDGDKAGIKAGERAIPLLLEQNVKGSVVVLPEGEDPYDFLLHRGASALQEKLQKTLSLFDFKLFQIQTRHQQMETPEDRLAGLNEFKQFISEVSNHLVREVWLQEICQRFQIDPETLKKQKKTYRSTPAQKDESKKENEPKRLSISEKFLLRTCFFLPELLPKILTKIAIHQFPTTSQMMLQQLLTLKPPQQKFTLEYLLCHSQEDWLKELWIQLIQEEEFVEPTPIILQNHLDKLCEHYHLPKIRELIHRSQNESSLTITNEGFQKRQDVLKEYQSTPKPKFFGLKVTSSSKK